jgi:indolepyruvate ferredoxin oxidoreductase alpha subunit
MTHVVEEDSPGKYVMLLGNDALARGAIEGGVKVVASYPGTPSSEITDTLAQVARNLGFYVETSVNEKVAFDIAVGASLVGVRAMTCAKNAGILWAADMFTTVTYGGIRGGFVIVAADDPEARYSSSQHDSRWTAMDAEVLILEPWDQQEAKDMVKHAFELSEQIELPVVVRSLSRLSHVSGAVELGPLPKSQAKAVFDKHWKMPYRWNIYGPTKIKGIEGTPGPDVKHTWIHTRIPIMKQIAEKLPYNRATLRKKAKRGVIGVGIGAAYSQEALKKAKVWENTSFLKLGTSHPIPEKMIGRFLKNLDSVVVAEDGDPIAELQIRALVQSSGLNVDIFGKAKNPVFPPHGELSPQIVMDGISRAFKVRPPQLASRAREELGLKAAEHIVPRSSALCAGCPHVGTWWAVRMAAHRLHGVPIVNGDIGCYEQAGYGLFSGEIEPSDSVTSKGYTDESLYDYLDTNYIMGGGIGLAQGQVRAGYSDGPIFAVAGDSTFFHACLPPLANAVWNKTKVTFIIFDNQWTAMTGRQPNPATGRTAMGEKTEVMKIEDLARGMGVKFVEVVDAYDLKKNVDVVIKAAQFDGPAVVVFRRICALQGLRLKEIIPTAYVVDRSRCNGCRLCVRLGCPAVKWDEPTKKASVDDLSCIGCAMCATICPMGAISPTKVA